MKRFLGMTACVLGIVVGSSHVYGQNVRKCANDILLEEANKNPETQARLTQYFSNVEDRTNRYNVNNSGAANKTTASVTLPVVFHVILTQAQINQLGGEAGLYDRVATQMDVINNDFNAKNADLSNVPSAFTSVIGNAQINFGMAHRKPDGSGTTGIEIRVATAGFAGFPVGDVQTKLTNAGGLDPWDPTKYLNVWVVNIDNSSTSSLILGYGYSPAYTAALQNPYESPGVVIHYGTLGSRISPFQYFVVTSADKGRTLTHELGHYFNIFHIWGNTPVGSGNCSDDDGFGDTPRQEDATQSCPNPNTVVPNCTSDPHPGGEMYMNYMDYSGDRCTYMFTKQQVQRMQAEVNPGGDSYSLTQQGNILTWPTAVSSIEINNEFNVFPNPSNGNFTLNFAKKLDELKSISVVNMYGQLIKNIEVSDQAVQSYNININGVASGMYYVQCHFEGNTLQKKLVIR